MAGRTAASRANLGVAFALLACLPAAAQGIAWPAGQVVPRFADYSALDVADISGLDFDRKASITTLQGLVNRARPRLYLLDAQRAGEGKTFWLDRITAAKTSLADPMSVFIRYRADIAGLCVWDPAVMGTINVAVTAAGILGCVAASPSLAQTLGAAPYSLPVLLDLRSKAFADDRAAFSWSKAEYGGRATRRMLAGMRPGVHYTLFDYVVANKALCVWLAPEDSLDRPVLGRILQDMPANSVYVGWWAGETAGVGFASRYGVITYATDWFCNATVFGGGSASLAGLPEVAAPPKPSNRAHIALIVSDGDNLQLQQHLFTKRWASPARGTFPVSWTQSPALADFAPGILNHYYATRTPNDCFITGPTGVGYVLPEHMEGADLREFANLTEAYLRRTGIRTATMWGNTAAASDTFGVHCPSLLGMANHQHGEPLAPRGFKRWAGGGVSVDMTPDYASFASQAISELGGKIAAWDRKGPLYLTAQLNANVANLEELKKVYDHWKDSAHVVFLRADQLFQLMRGGGTVALARPAATARPVGLRAAAGYPGAALFPLPGGGAADARGKVMPALPLAAP